MKKLLTAALSLALFGAGCDAQSFEEFEQQQPETQSPVAAFAQALGSNKYGADPAAIVANGQLHVVRTGDALLPLQTAPTALGIDALSNASLMLTTRPADAADASTWAPAIRKVNSKYVIWYSQRPVTIGTRPTTVDSKEKCLFRATSDYPGSGYVPYNVKTCVASQDPDQLEFAIDPYVTTGTGQPWLYAKIVGYGLARRQLDYDNNGNSFTTTSQWRTVMPPSGGWQKGPVQTNPCVENPAVVKLGARWFMFYSGNNWKYDTYGIGYAHCGTDTVPTATCTDATKSAAWVRHDNSTMNGPGGQGFFNHGGAEYMVFHGYEGSCVADGNLPALKCDGSPNNPSGRKMYLVKVSNVNGAPSRSEP